MRRDIGTLRLEDVFVQGQEALMVEPASGQQWNVQDAPYGTVEFLWNHTNFWASLQIAEDVWDTSMNPASISFDLSDTTKWEQLFLDTEGKVVSLVFAAFTACFASIDMHNAARDSLQAKLFF